MFYVSKILGDGSAFNIGRGNNSAYFIKNNEMFLIDCGNDVFSKVLFYKLFEKHKIIKLHIFISHLHNDHIGSLASMIFFWYYHKNDKVNVYHLNTKRLIEYLDIVGVGREMYDMKHEYLSKGLSLSFVKTSHVFSMESFGIEILNGDKKYYFSGDTNNIVKKIKENYDEFYVDTCSKDYVGNPHLNVYTLIDLVPECKRKNVFCYHLDDSDTLPNVITSNGFRLVEVYNGEDG